MEIMAFDETGGMSQIILEAIRGRVAHRPQELDFLKKSLQGILEVGGREAVVVTAEELIKALERSIAGEKADIKMSRGNPVR